MKGKLAIVALIGLFFPLVSLAYSPKEIVQATNVYRVEHSLAPLSTNPQLQIVAQFIAQDMANKAYWSHNNLTGQTPWFWLNVAGYKYKYAGQNLARKFTTTEENMQSWIKSPTHNANLLFKGFQETGVGMATSSDGKVYVVQYFGSR